MERDPTHAQLARANRRRLAAKGRIKVLVGDGLRVLVGLEGPYDLIFSDGDPDDFPWQLDHLRRLLRRGGQLISANLFLGQQVSGRPEPGLRPGNREPRPPINISGS